MSHLLTCKNCQGQFESDLDVDPENWEQVQRAVRKDGAFDHWELVAVVKHAVCTLCKKRVAYRMEDFVKAESNADWIADLPHFGLHNLPESALAVDLETLLDHVMDRGLSHEFLLPLEEALDWAVIEKSALFELHRLPVDLTDGLTLGRDVAEALHLGRKLKRPYVTMNSIAESVDAADIEVIRLGDKLPEVKEVVLDFQSVLRFQLRGGQKELKIAHCGYGVMDRLKEFVGAEEIKLIVFTNEERAQRDKLMDELSIGRPLASMVLISGHLDRPLLTDNLELPREIRIRSLKVELGLATEVERRELEHNRESKDPVFIPDESVLAELIRTDMLLDYVSFEITTDLEEALEEVFKLDLKVIEVDQVLDQRARDFSSQMLLPLEVARCVMLSRDDGPLFVTHEELPILVEAHVADAANAELPSWTSGAVQRVLVETSPAGIFGEVSEKPLDPPANLLTQRPGVDADGAQIEVKSVLLQLDTLLEWAADDNLELLAEVQIYITDHGRQNLDHLQSQSRFVLEADSKLEVCRPPIEAVADPDFLIHEEEQEMEKLRLEMARVYTPAPPPPGIPAWVEVVPLHGDEKKLVDLIVTQVEMPQRVAQGLVLAQRLGVLYHLSQ